MIEFVNFKDLGNEKASLIALEGIKDIPFNFKRIYFIQSIDTESSRGFHAHKELTQVAICLSGSFKMVFDDGTVNKSFIMDSPQKGVIIPPMIWHEMHEFSSDCIILVLASNLYDEEDYIRNYELFLKEKN